MYPHPSNGLGSNSNYLLNNNCKNLNNVAITLDVSTDIVASAGFGFQLNAYSPKNETCAIQQYVIVVDTSGQMNCIVNNWQNASTALINNWIALYKLPSATLPARHQCRIALQNDGAGNVTAASYTVSTLGVAPASDSALSSYWGSDGSQHVNFIGSDGHLHEMYARSGGGWGNNDLTAMSGGGVLPAGGSALHAYWGSDGSQHVNFIGSDGHLHEMYARSGGGWGNNDLTAMSGGGVLPASGSLSSYWGSDGRQRVNFIGSDGHVHELYSRPGGGWLDNDLTNVALASVTQTLLAISGVSSADLSPIVAFELDIVGHDNGQSTNLSSGSGTITYTAANAMTVVNAEPSCCEFDGGTLETANTVYGELPTGSSASFVQTFDKSAATIKAPKRNGLIKTRPNSIPYSPTAPSR
jgi:hypothetical protein